MKKIILFFIVVSISYTLHSQVIELNFETQNVDDCFTIDSIYVLNINKIESKMLKNQVTHLVLQKELGLNEYDTDNQEFKLSSQMNPYNEQTEVILNMVENELVEISMYDVTGRLTAQYKAYLNAGEHLFKIQSAGQGLQMVVAKTAHQISALKLMNMNAATQSSLITYQSMLKSNNGQVVKETAFKTGKDTMVYATDNQFLIIAYMNYLRDTLKIKPTVSLTHQFKNNERINVDTSHFIDARDGNAYKTVTIGTQTWMSENLRYLPMVDSVTTGSDTDAYYYVYGYNGTKIEDAKSLNLAQAVNGIPTGTNVYQNFGVLYNRIAAIDACPTDWHLPNDAEWETLTTYLSANGYNYDGTKTGKKYAKSLATKIGWRNYLGQGLIGDENCANNSSGFNALPVGYRKDNATFDGLGNSTNFWSATVYGDYSTRFYLSYFYSDTMLSHGVLRETGCSIRCIKD